MGRELQEEARGGVDHGRDLPLHHAALRPGALLWWLLFPQLLLALLRLFGPGAGHPLRGFAGNRGARPEGRQQNCDGQFPLHEGEVAPARLNGK